MVRTVLVACISAAFALALAVASADAVSVTITGPEQMVFDWTTQRCDDFDVPDGPVQPLRDSNDRIQLVTPGSTGRRFVGPDFDHLTRLCTSLMSSPRDPNPAHFNDANWLGALYTENGRDIYALVHSEYHGWEHPGYCPSGRTRLCNSAGITWAESHDNGDSYVRPAPPDNLVAAIPPRVTVDFGRSGLYSPTNPVKKGNYFYSLMLIQAVGDQDVGVCPMRTRDITDPKSWRGWDGSSFSTRFVNPYYENARPQRLHTCEPVAPTKIMQMARSVTYNTVLGKYVLTGSAVKFDPDLSRNVYGFYFATSDDLVHWSDRQLIMEAPSLLTHQCGGPDAVAYPSLVDPDSTDRNYRITDATVDMYFTRLHYNAACQLTFDRDLVRVPLQFSP